MSKSKEDKMKDKIMFDNVFEVIVIDKNTGKVKQHVKVKNATLQGLAGFVANFLFQPESAGAQYPGFQYLNIFTSAKSYVKSLSGTWGTQIDTGSDKRNSITWTDSSSDTYTVAYTTASRGSNNSYGASAFFASALPSPVTKGTTDAITYRWTITVPYQAPP
jgi:hypothetical protein